MAVRTHDVYRRDTLTLTADVVGDWTAWTFKADLRSEPDNDATKLASFTVGAPTYADGRTEVVFTISAATMQGIEDRYRSGYYDLRAALAGVETTLAAGRLILQENVTP